MDTVGRDNEVCGQVARRGANMGPLVDVPHVELGHRHTHVDRPGRQPGGEESEQGGAADHSDRCPVPAGQPLLFQAQQDTAVGAAQFHRRRPGCGRVEGFTDAEGAQYA